MDIPEATKMTARDTGCSNLSIPNCGNVVSVGFPITMMVTGVVGNSLALILVYTSYGKKENRRKKSFLLFIGSLALTDLFGQLLTSPVVISVYLADQRLSMIDTSGNLCAYFGVCMTTFGLCALFLASAMATERAMAITNPHWYSNHMKTSITKQSLVAIWCAGFLFALLPVAGIGEYTEQWPGTWCFIRTGKSEAPGNGFFAYTFAFLGVSSLLVTLCCNVMTIRGLIIRCKTKTGASQSSKHWERLTTETVIQLLGIMCVQIICWSPLLGMLLRMIYSQVSSEECNSAYKKTSNIQNKVTNLDCDFFLPAIRLASLNQILDPWVYLLLREILLRKFCIMANAVSNCSMEDQKETQTAMDALNKNKHNQDGNSICKSPSS
ncbi:prostaglandin E2 receptor EP3 subtype [Cyprinodon tularosa]|uniref:Prostaglandin E2 receptor EP3 subtype n=1 Tax=Cyprinodon variegatus TaxID=28743 RepID=A0A3Q2CUT9_CYPVA|nr:PREDICTED: prostaglandin E2 receptor EP3 subtype [Cyprinodon variegatus]XP_038157623.1 prostaglandin E2 receptor EP3 subtype [Cyprinodon tularosa]